MTEFTFTALVNIMVVLAFWAYSYFKGRKIVSYMKQHHLDAWKEWGEPTPDYMGAPQKWYSFMRENKYRDLRDRKLVNLCEDQRKLERITITLTILFFVVFGGIAVWNEYFI